MVEAVIKRSSRVCTWRWKAFNTARRGTISRRERPDLRSRRRREELDDVAGGGEEEAAVVRVADGGEQAARRGGGAGHRVRVCSRTVAISASRHAATCSQTRRPHERCVFWQWREVHWCREEASLLLKANTICYTRPR